MSLEDAVNAEWERQRGEAARRRETDSEARLDRDRGRAELRQLISEAYSVLKRNGGPRAVNMRVQRTKTMFGAEKYVASGEEVGYAVYHGGSRLVFTDDGLLRKTLGGGNQPYGWDSKASGEAIAAFQSRFQGASFGATGDEISWELIKPSGWDDEFFVENGQLVYGYCESWRPPLARIVVTEWVAKALAR